MKKIILLLFTLFAINNINANIKINKDSIINRVAIDVIHAQVASGIYGTAVVTYANFPNPAGSDAYRMWTPLVWIYDRIDSINLNYTLVAPHPAYMGNPYEYDNMCIWQIDTGIYYQLKKISGGGNGGTVSGTQPQIAFFSASTKVKGTYSTATTDYWSYDSVTNRLTCSTFGNTSSIGDPVGATGYIQWKGIGTEIYSYNTYFTTIYGGTTTKGLEVNTSGETATYIWKLPTANTSLGILEQNNSSTGQLLWNTVLNNALVAPTKNEYFLSSPPNSLTPLWRVIQGVDLLAGISSIDTGAFLTGATATIQPAMWQGNDYQSYVYAGMIRTIRDSINTYKMAVDTLMAVNYFQIPFYSTSHTPRFAGEMWYNRSTHDSSMCFATRTGTSIGKVDSLNFGHWHTFTPAMTNVSAPTVTTARYTMVGKCCSFTLEEVATKTTTAATAITLPFIANNTGAIFMRYSTNGVIGTGNALITAGSQSCTLFTQLGANFTVSTALQVDINGSYEIQ